MFLSILLGTVSSVVTTVVVIVSGYFLARRELLDSTTSAKLSKVTFKLPAALFHGLGTQSSDAGTDADGLGVAAILSRSLCDGPGAWSLLLRSVRGDADRTLLPFGNPRCGILWQLDSTAPRAITINNHFHGAF